MSTLGDRVKERMKALSLTNVELARAAKVKPPTAFNWGSGKTKAIKGEPLLRAAAVLGVTPQWLATGIGKKLAEPTSTSYAAAAPSPINRVAEPQRNYGWPFKTVTPQLWDLLNVDEKNLIENTVLMAVKNRGDPANQRSLAKSTAGR